MTLDVWIQISIGLLSLVALFRPEWNGFFRKWLSDIDVQPSGRLEIGYGTFGPSIALQGSLRAIHYDQFISEMIIEVERVQDKQKFHLDWRLFRSPAVSVDLISKKEQNIELEIASPFSANIQSYQRFNIMFSDIKTILPLSGEAVQLKENWNNFVASSEGRRLLNTVKKEGNELAALSTIIETFRLYDNNLEKGNLNELYNALTRKMYWEPGTYQMNLSIKYANANTKKCYEGEFDISEVDSRNLRKNVMLLIFSGIGFNFDFNFAYVELKNFREKS